MFDLVFVTFVIFSTLLNSMEIVLYFLGDAIVQWLACSTTGREVVGSSPAPAAGSRVATVGQLLFAPWAYSTLYPHGVGK